jgi:hypothetical protein
MKGQQTKKGRRENARDWGVMEWRIPVGGAERAGDWEGQRETQVQTRMLRREMKKRMGRERKKKESGGANQRRGRERKRQRERREEEEEVTTITIAKHENTKERRRDGTGGRRAGALGDVRTGGARGRKAEEGQNGEAERRAEQDRGRTDKRGVCSQPFSHSKRRKKKAFICNSPVSYVAWAPTETRGRSGNLENGGHLTALKRSSGVAHVASYHLRRGSWTPPGRLFVRLALN